MFLGKNRQSWLFDQKWIKIKTTGRRILRVFWRFDKWHEYPVNTKPYVRYIISMIEDLSPANRGTIVEVGCGIGDIIGNIVGGRKVGFDLDLQAIKCAKILHPRTSFVHGTISDVEIGLIDFFVMVNWEAGISSDVIREWLNDCNSRNTVNMYVVDKFTQCSNSYPYTHDWESIFGQDYVLFRRSRGFMAADSNRRYIEFWVRKEYKEKYERILTGDK